MSSRKSRIRQNFVATMREQEGPTAFSEGASEPSYPVPDPFHEMEVKKLKEVNSPTIEGSDSELRAPPGPRDFQEGVFEAL